MEVENEEAYYKLRKESEDKNPYSQDLENMHLWSEGYRIGHDEGLNKPNFIKPDIDTIVKFAIAFNSNMEDESRIVDMTAMAELMIDRLHEHGDLMKKCSKEVYE